MRDCVSFLERSMQRSSRNSKNYFTFSDPVYFKAQADESINLNNRHIDLIERKVRYVRANKSNRRTSY